MRMPLKPMRVPLKTSRAPLGYNPCPIKRMSPSLRKRPVRPEIPLKTSQ